MTVDTTTIVPTNFGIQFGKINVLNTLITKMIPEKIIKYFSFIKSAAFKTILHFFTKNLSIIKQNPR
ncbi:hypothetical protein AYR57_05870 [Pediococcus claussenii]|nr:hypothetical protein AYR57_05870 [Pediococcus claussenii]ANZ71680.1 hypothetical protein AYR58_05875 [Pediococcus claussenii]